ncbi:pilus assembly protein PilS [Neisseria meningitidis]|nr:pilus assembly protein PilS [Neisseria meningitidis]
MKDSSFPRKWESRPVGTETYRIKRFLQPYALDSRFCGNDEGAGMIDS